MSETNAVASPEEIRQARAFLHQRGLGTSLMPPRLFAFTAKKTGKSFSELLKLIARLKMGGQGLGQSPIAEAINETKEKKSST